MKRMLTILALLLAAPALFAGEKIPAAGEFILNVDYSTFKDQPESGYIEVYYSFYPKLLTYLHEQGRFDARVNITTTFENTLTSEVVASRVVPIVISEQDTSAAWYRYAMITQAGFNLPRGDYLMKVVATDSLEASQVDSVSLQVAIQDFQDGLRLSDLQLCKTIKKSNKSNDLFFKNSLEVVPLPALVFGSASSPVLFHYAEVYNVKPNAQYHIRTRIVDSNGQVVREKKRTRSYAHENSLVVGNTTVTSLQPGEYSLVCTVMNSDGVELTHSEKTFYVFNPHLEIAAKTEGPNRILLALRELSGKQLDKEFAQVRYLATDQQIRIYEEITEESGKRQFLATLWSDLGRGSIDRPPIFRREYLARIEVANKEFGALGKEGWRTDRGRVFVLYGRPDEIERTPAEAGTRAHQIWTYFTIESGVDFVFVDRTGYRDMHLVHSTKRGELRDDNWERLLR